MVGDSGRAGGTVAFARAEWRARRQSHLVIALLAALTVGVLVATLCAAERSRTAFDRLREATHASDVMVFVSGGDPQETVRELRRTPGVIDARGIVELAVRPAGTDLMPILDLKGFAPRVDDRAATVDTPIITEGRAPHPDRPDEVALSAGLARDLGVASGDELRLDTLTAEWMDEAFAGSNPGRADGPTVAVTVTGIARSPAEFGQAPAVVHLTPAFVDRYGDGMEMVPAIHVRLEPEALERFQNRKLLLVSGSQDLESPFGDRGAARDGLATIATGLLVLGLVAGVAGTLALVLALARASRASMRDRSTLVALGWTRGDELHGLALAYVPTVVVGLVVGVAGGVLASPRALVGLAGAIDPRPDAVLVRSGLVLALAGGAIVVALAVLVAVGALATRRSPRSTSRVVRTPLGRPLPVTLGLRHAFGGPADRGGRASRGALAAVIGATAVALGALVVGSSIGRLQSDPSLSGRWSEQVVDGGFSFEVVDEVLLRLYADDRVAALAALHQDIGTMPGIGDVDLLVYDHRRGRLDVSITEGRMPRAPDEIALGPATLEMAGARVGEEIRLSAVAGAAHYRVVGAVLFPEGDFTHDEGAALTVAAAELVLGDAYKEERFIHQVMFDWADEVDVVAADRELEEAGLILVPSATGLRPPAVKNLGEVEHLPRPLALLLGLLAAATLLHAAWTGTTQRSRELVTLRALGVTRRSTAVIAWTQSLAVVAIGLLIGVPLGVVAGRQTWRPIAEDAHVVVRPVLSWWSLGLVVGTIVVAGLVVAALAGHRVQRLRPAAALRAD